jgi:biotin carboxylase
MNENESITILCLASYFKGGDFITACKNRGCRVILLTKENLADEPWPWQAIDERFLMPDLSKQPDIQHAVSYLARSRKIDRIVPLDDFDVETAAALREHLRIPGMGDTTARYFRDKLAMRIQAQEKGILVPAFSPVINYAELSDYIGRVSPPWVLKPRSQAGSMGIKKIFSADELWRTLDELGDKGSYFVLEQFVSGDIFHVDSIISEREIVFDEVNKYKQPPLTVSHQGGVFISRTMPRDLPLVAQLKQLNSDLMRALGMLRGVTHAEFIQGSEDGQLYFLETAARVAGANIPEMIDFATGINLWEEWAEIELSHARGEDYQHPRAKDDYAGIIICLAKQDYPDLTAYDDPEIVWRLDKKSHAGLIVTSQNQGRVEELIDDYRLRFSQDFLAFVPPLNEAPD